MKREGVDVNARAIALRAEFDRSFAAVPDPTTSAVENLLAIGVGEEQYLLRLSAVSELHAGKTVTWLPSPVPELLGIAGFRGTVLPVYDLAMLLGKPKAAAPRWVVVAKDAHVALAFEAFIGFVRARSEAIVPNTHDAAARQIREMLSGEIVRPIVHLAAILEPLLARGRAAGPS